MVKKAQVEQPGRPGRKPSLNAEHTTILRAITQELPRSSLDEVTRELFRRAGVKISTVTVRKALREAGIERLKPLRRAGERAAVQGAAPKRYGYTAAHRRTDGANGMNTDLTDAEWALVADLFERDGLRGAGHEVARDAVSFWPVDRQVGHRSLDDLIGTPAGRHRHLSCGSPARTASRARFDTLSTSPAQLRPDRSNGSVPMLRKRSPSN